MKSADWFAQEWPPGISMRANKNGVTLEYGNDESRTLNPAQARALGQMLIEAAGEAEKRGAKDWMTP